MYRAEQYRKENGRYVWAVLDTATNVFYFQKGYGRQNASKLASKMNQDITLANDPVLTPGKSRQ